MTIEKAHEILSNGLVNAPSEHEWVVAFLMALDTMHRYLMIQEIYKKFQKDGYYDSYMAWLDVRKVVEDENINN